MNIFIQILMQLIVKIFEKTVKGRIRFNINFFKALSFYEKQAGDLLNLRKGGRCFTDFMLLQ